MFLGGARKPGQPVGNPHGHQENMQNSAKIVIQVQDQTGNPRAVRRQCYLMCLQYCPSFIVIVLYLQDIIPALCLPLYAGYQKQLHIQTLEYFFRDLLQTQNSSNDYTSYGQAQPQSPCPTVAPSWQISASSTHAVLWESIYCKQIIKKGEHFLLVANHYTTPLYYKTKYACYCTVLLSICSVLYLNQNPDAHCPFLLCLLTVMLSIWITVMLLKYCSFYPHEEYNYL